MRKETFSNGEMYHVYNQGVDKRNIFLDEKDVERFCTTLTEFNTVEPSESLYALNLNDTSFSDQVAKKKRPLVNFIAYCLNPNHFHFLLEQIEDGGISKFLKRICGGYSWYFNKKYDRRGALFQGPFKVKHVYDDSYFLHASVYVSLNDQVHRIPKKFSHLVRSSWNEYAKSDSPGICKKQNVLEQFDTLSKYISFAKETLESMRETKDELKELKKFLIEEDGTFSDQVAKKV